MICSAYQHQPDAIKDWGWSRKISKTVNWFLDCLHMNFDDQGRWLAKKGDVIGKYNKSTRNWVIKSKGLLAFEPLLENISCRSLRLIDGSGLSPGFAGCMDCFP